MSTSATQVTNEDSVLQRTAINPQKTDKKVHTMYCFQPYEIVFVITAYGMKNVLTVTINNLLFLTFNAWWPASHDKKNKISVAGIFFPSVQAKVPLIHVPGVKAPNGISTT